MATERRLPAREAQPPVSRPHRLRDRRKGKRHGQRLQPLPAAPALSVLGRSAATAADGPPRRHHRLAPVGRAASGRRLADPHLTGQLGGPAPPRPPAGRFRRTPPEAPPPLHFRVRSCAITAEREDAGGGRATRPLPSTTGVGSRAETSRGRSGAREGTPRRAHRL